jgi:Acetyltransferase (GNAT) domain
MQPTENVKSNEVVARRWSQVATEGNGSDSSRVTLLDDAELSEWDEFVSGHPRGLAYHLSAWKHVIENTFPHIRGQFLALRENNSGRIIAGLPVYIVRSWLLGNRAVSVPFASVMDPLIGGTEDLLAFFPSLTGLLRQSGSMTLEIRSLYSAKLVAATNLCPKVGYKHHYIPLSQGPDTLLRGFSESCVRRKIRKAENQKITVTVGGDERDWRVYYDILTETRRRLSIPPLPFRFFEAMRQYIPPRNRTLFIGLQGGVPIGCLLTLNLGDVWAVEYSGDTSAARSSGVNQLLYWEAIQLAYSQGAKTFSLGRTSVVNHGLLDYKRRWATIEEDLTDFTFPAIRGREKTSRSREASTAYRLVRGLVRRVPMPIYRKIGSFCYRHLG